MPREFSIERIGQQSSRNHAPIGRNRIDVDQEYLDEQERIEKRRMHRQRHTVRKMKRDSDGQYY